MQKPRLSVFPRQESSSLPGDDQNASRPATAKKVSPRRVEEELDRVCGTLSPRTVTLRLATIVPLLLDAVEHNRTWLSDFADDTVRLDADLYEVLLAYQEIRGGAAA